MHPFGIVIALTGVVVCIIAGHGFEEAVSAEGADECANSDGEDCALNALQRRTQKVESAETLDNHLDVEYTEEATATATLDTEAAELALQAAEENAENLRSLLSPRLRYNSSGTGGRRAPYISTLYDGLEDERIFQVSESDSEYGLTHVFAIGDWGATLPGHYTAPNKRGPGRKCPNNCGYVNGIDDRAQILVANVMKQRAGNSNPQYVLNVGDNFYWSGIREGCSSAHASGATHSDFASGWQGVYGGLTSKPWISCLGNHDYGGWQFNHGWPQQIGYSFVNRNWVMPGRYFSRKMHHPGYTVEYFVIDSNAYDAKDPGEDPEHNICSRQHNPGDANCAAGGGPSSVGSCKSWFWSGYAQQKRWLQSKLSQSTADWQVVVTHFPCGHDAGFYRMLHTSYGLDLLVTGHRHDQELWPNSGMMGGLTCFVTGGGGGITSESVPTMDNTQYGFFDLTFSKTKIQVELIGLNGAVLRSSWVYPKRR